jgi:regulator of replication initiation timing
MKEGKGMKEEKIRRIFRLIEPLLPKQEVSDFEKFIDDFIELKQMYQYTSQLNEMLRDSVEVLRKKLNEKEIKEKELMEKNIRLIQERNKALQQKYETEGQLETLKKQITSLEKQYNEKVKQINDERENFFLLIQKAVKDNQQLLWMVQELNHRLKQSVPISQYQKQEENFARILQEKKQEIEWLIKENRELRMEREAYKERLAYEFQNGFKKALLQERKRKR